MSDIPRPELRQLAETLFAAGRAERPEPALARRLALIASQRRALLEPDRRAPALANAAWRRRGLSMSVAALGMVAALGGLWLSAPGPRAIVISGERAVRAGRSEREAGRAVAGASSDENAPEPHAATVDAVPPPVDSAPRPRKLPRNQQHRPTAQPPAAPPVAPATEVSDAPAPARSSMSLSAELDLLKRARAALRSRVPEQALALLDQHAREHSGDGLSSEATVLRIEALAALGRHDEASALAVRFVRDDPSGAFADRARTFIRGGAR